MARRIGLAALLLASGSTGAPAALGAQTVVPIEAGTPIRVLSPAFTGTARAALARDDTLTLVVGGAPAPILLPIPSIQRLQIFHRNSRARGARRGALWGLLAGSAAFALSNAFVDYGERFPTRPGYTSLSLGGAIALYVGGGTALGALYGAARPGSRWQTIQGPLQVWVTQ